MFCFYYRFRVQNGYRGATADHLHCSVCLEHYKGRNPRLLSCHHSFCEGCLMELVKHGQISCPSCREMTAVRDGDVTNLTMNFHLLPFLEDTRSFEKKCQFCNLSVAIFKCEECTQVLCQDCSESHSKVKRFKDHHVLQLCVIHYEGVSQICLQCVKPVCFKCLVLEHQEHEDKVVSYEEGTKLLRENIKRIYAQLEQNIGCIDEKIKEDDLKIVEAEQMVRKYKSKQKELEKQTKECKLIIEVIQKQYSDKEKIQKEREEQRAAAENKRKLVNELKMLDKSGDEHMLSHYVELTKSANTCLGKCVSEVKKNPSLIATIININKNKQLVLRPERVTTIKSNKTLKLKDVTSGTSTWDNSIIIADHGQHQVTQINQQGEVEGIYPVQEEYGELWEVYLHGSSLYIGQEYGVSQIVDINKPNSSTRKYGLQQGYRLDGMCVVSHTKVLYADLDCGKVCQYDPHDQSTKQVLEGLNQPSYITSLINDKGVQYIVTLQGGHCLEMYNSKWQYKYTVGKGKGSGDGFLLYPGGTVCTDEGILVADNGNNRVCLFDVRGKFVRNYLTEDDGIVDPNGMVYRPPYLWVLCKEVLLCYKVH